MSMTEKDFVFASIKVSLDTHIKRLYEIGLNKAEIEIELHTHIKQQLKKLGDD